MNKRIIIILTIIVNLINAYFLFQDENKTIYSEEVVRNITYEVNSDLNNFLNLVYSEYENVKDKFSGEENFSQKKLDDYFIFNSGLNNSIYSLFFKKNNKFYVVNSEKKTLKSAYNTLGNINVVKWNRYKNSKFIDSWNEIIKIDSSSEFWLNISNNNIAQNTLVWGIGDGKNIEGTNLLICAIKWKNINSNVLIFRFLNNNKNVLKNSIKYKKEKLIINTSSENYIEFTKDTVLNFKEKQLNKAKYNFEKTILEYSDHLNTNDSIFSFSYNDKLYWTIRLKFNKKYGIKNFLLTFSDEEIITKNTPVIHIILSIILLFLSIFIILFLLKIIKLKTTKPKFDSQEVLASILKNDESRYLEFKSSLRWDYRQQIVNPELENVILKTIAAFGNSDGGILLIGVDDDKNIIGLENDYLSLKKYGADFFEIYLRNIFHKHMGVKYVTENIRITFHKFDEKEICKIEIFKANEPLYLKLNKKGNVTEKFYVRSGNSSNELNSLKDINDYIFNRFKK